MADFAVTSITVTGVQAPFGAHPGNVTFTIVLTGVTYVAGNLNLTGATNFNRLASSVRLEDIRAIFFTPGAAAGKHADFELAASPTWANLGTLKLFAGATEATGSLTLKLYGYAPITRLG